MNCVNESGTGASIAVEIGGGWSCMNSTNEGVAGVSAAAAAAAATAARAETAVSSVSGDTATASTCRPAAITDTDDAGCGRWFPRFHPKNAAPLAHNNDANAPFFYKGVYHVFMQVVLSIFCRAPLSPFPFATT